MNNHKSCKRTLVGRGVAGILALQMTFWHTAPLLALPQGEQVQHGEVQFTRDGNNLTVNQASGQAIVNYSAFDIGAVERVQFVQPSSAAAILNRVVGGSGSTIAGFLVANGKVYLINPNGILFTSSAHVDVGGLVASALNMSDDDFLAGRLYFSGGGGSVINEGEIRGGVVYLFGATVENLGSILSSDVILAAGGQSVEIDKIAGGSVRIIIDGIELTHEEVADPGTGGDVTLDSTSDIDTDVDGTAADIEGDTIVVTAAAAGTGDDTVLQVTSFSPVNEDTTARDRSVIQLVTEVNVTVNVTDAGTDDATLEASAHIDDGTTDIEGALVGRATLTEAQEVEVEEMLGLQGASSNPYFVKSVLQVAEPLAPGLFDYILIGKATIDSDPQLPSDLATSIVIGGLELLAEVMPSYWEFP